MERVTNPCTETTHYTYHTGIDAVPGRDRYFSVLMAISEIHYYSAEAPAIEDIILLIQFVVFIIRDSRHQDKAAR